MFDASGNEITTQSNHGLSFNVDTVNSSNTLEVNGTGYNTDHDRMSLRYTATANGHPDFTHKTILTKQMAGTQGPGVMVIGHYDDLVAADGQPTRPLNNNQEGRDVVYDEDSAGNTQHWMYIGDDGVAIQDVPTTPPNDTEDHTTDGTYWSMFQAFDLIASGVNITNESYVKNTINVGTSDPNATSSAIAISGNNNNGNPFISVGQTVPGYATNVEGTDDQDGIFLGLDGSVPKFSMKAGEDFLRWNNTDLEMSGNIIAKGGHFEGLVSVGESGSVGIDPLGLPGDYYGEDVNTGAVSINPDSVEEYVIVNDRNTLYVNYKVENSGYYQVQTDQNNNITDFSRGDITFDLLIRGHNGTSWETIKSQRHTIRGKSEDSDPNTYVEVTDLPVSAFGYDKVQLDTSVVESDGGNLTNKTGSTQEIKEKLLISNNGIYVGGLNSVVKLTVNSGEVKSQETSTVAWGSMGGTIANQTDLFGTGLISSNDELTVDLGDFSTDDIGSEGINNKWFTNERVDDRVNTLLSGGTGLS